MIPVAPDAGVRFNPPPAWTAPSGFDPRRGHLADPAWPAAPEGWLFWVADPTVGRKSETAILPSATLPRGRLESGERRRLVIVLTCVVAVAALLAWGASMSDENEVSAGVGSCWTGGDRVTEVSCDSPRAVYIVEQEVSTPELCPSSPAGYLEGGGTILCLRSLS